MLQKVKDNVPKGTHLKHVQIDGYEFKSPLEGYTYEAFKQAHIPVKYEPEHYELLPKFDYLGKRYRNIKYTPDFIGDNFVCECKGRVQRDFPLRWKMLLHKFKSIGEERKAYIVRNHKDVTNMIQDIIGNGYREDKLANTTHKEEHERSSEAA